MFSHCKHLLCLLAVNTQERRRAVAHRLIQMMMMMMMMMMMTEIAAQARALLPQQPIKRTASTVTAATVNFSATDR